MIGNEGTVGVNAAVMNDSKLNLGRYSEAISGLIDELNALKRQLPAHWQGDDLELFIAQFTDFEKKLSQLPAVINSIASWTGDTTAEYMASQDTTKANLGSIYGGLV